MIVANGRIMLYSAECGNEARASIDGVPMKVGVTKTTIEPRSMELEEIKKATDKISKTVDVVKALNGIAKSLADALEEKESQTILKEQCGTIAAVGEIIKGILKIIPGPQNPMIAEMHKLVESVEKLKGELSQGFSQLKSIITEVNFFAKILCPTSVLSKYMRDCIKRPGPDSKENFRRAYAKHSPLKLAYKLTSCLENGSTNPVNAAVAAGGEQAKVIFDMWKNIICRILGHLLLLESFSKGLFGIQSNNNIDTLILTSVELYQTVNGWEKEFQENEGRYWDELKDWVWNHVVGRMDVGNETKVKMVEEKLKEYASKFVFINDAFTVGTFETCEDRDNEFTYHCPNESSQMYMSLDWGSMNIFVYRSRTAESKTQEDVANLVKTVELVRDSGIRDYGSLDEMMKTQIVEKGLAADYGFIFLVRAYKDLRSRTVTKADHEPSLRLKIYIPHINTEDYDLIISYH